MSSLIHDIANNEALLLMFLTGELPPDDRMEVEQMLAGDAGLRNELALIAADYDFALDSLAKLDADRSLIAGENHAIRQAKRAMRQWQIDRQNRPTALPPAGKRRFPAWVYPSAVAAMLLIGLLTYWGIAGDYGPSRMANSNATPGADAGSGSDLNSGLTSASGAVSGEDSKMAVTREDLLENSLRPADTASDLSAGERQASTLVARAESSRKIDEVSAALLEQ